MNARETLDNFLHVYGQYSYHDEAVIRGTRTALLQLREAIDDALENGISGTELFATDGEGYELRVVCVSTIAAVGKPEYRVNDVHEIEERRRERAAKLSAPCPSWDSDVVILSSSEVEAIRDAERRPAMNAREVIARHLCKRAGQGWSGISLYERGVYRTRAHNILAEVDAAGFTIMSKEDVEAVRAAMERSIVAIDDWLHQYASDMCSEDHVKATGRRIFENGGTLAYIADVQEKNRAASRALKAAMEAGR